MIDRQRRKSRRPVITTLVALVWLAAVPGLAQADAIDDFVQAELQSQQIPGVAVGIFRNGEPVHMQGYGLANIEHNVPVHPDTMFQSGSIGKMFTANAVMLLVEDGKVDVDASVREYLPDAPDSWQPITLRHLLNHTSGLGDPDLDLQREYTDEAYLAHHYATPLQFAPGQRWAYSNPGYSVLGFVVNKVAGKHYGELLRERIFEPAGMRGARVLNDRDIVMHRAAGYEMADGKRVNHQWASASMNALAEGSLYLNLIDYAQWDAVVAERGLLKAESWRQILQPARLGNGDSYPYGFGWSIEHATDEQLIIGHGGSWQGFRSDLRRYDGDGVTFVVLANAANADVSRILQGVAVRHDERYRMSAPKAITDEKPHLTAAVERLLERLRQDKATGQEVASEHPQWAAPLLERNRKVLDEAGACQALQLTRHQANGDRIERNYFGDCEQQGIAVSTQFDDGGRLLLLQLRPRRDEP